MFRKKPVVDWQFLSEEGEEQQWPPAPQGLESRAEPGRRPRLRRAILFGVIMALLLAAGVGAAYARHEALQGIQALEQDVQAAVEAEQWVRHNAPQLSAVVMVDDDASSYMAWVIEREQNLLAANTKDAGPDPVLHIQDIRYADGIAAAKLTLAQPAADGGAPAVYRQTRFYRETEEGWLRTRPDPALWGKPLHLETANLIWRYRRRDQAAVTEIADQIDALYVRLLRDYGLAPPPPQDKLVINVQVDYLPGMISLYVLPAEPNVVPSPSVYLMPVERTDAEILVQTVALALLKSMWTQAVAQHGIKQSWPVLTGMNLWQLWEMDLILSEWRDDIMQWVYGDETPASDSSAVTLPARYHELCAAHSLWMMKPVAIGIPLYCDSTDSSPWHNKVLLASLRSASLGRLRSASLGSFRQVSLWPPVDLAAQMGKSLLTSTVIDYAVTAYGRERLPDLVAALGRHDSWETLVPAVYGVSLDEFELGWQQHVADLAQCAGDPTCPW